MTALTLPTAFVEAARAARPAWRQIVAEVSDEHRVPVPAILGRSRKAGASFARQDAMARVHRKLGYSVSQVARLFGRDHTTVIYAIRRMARGFKTVVLPPHEEQALVNLVTVYGHMRQSGAMLACEIGTLVCPPDATLRQRGQRGRCIIARLRERGVSFNVVDGAFRLVRNAA